MESDIITPNGHLVKTLDELREQTPAVFATSSAPKNTKSYGFVDTLDIIKKIQKLGWELHAASQNGSSPYARHMVKFKSPKMGYMKQVSRDNVEPQIILDNSHNRMSSCQIHMGLFRLVCTNGLVVAIPGMATNVKFRHVGVDMEELKKVLEKMSDQYLTIGDKIQDMQNVKMTVDMQQEFAIRAIARREPRMFIKEDGTIDIKAVTASTNPIEILKPIRGEDRADNLWTTFNIIQERMVNGGYQRLSGSGRPSTTRGITNGTRNLEYNKELWSMAEEVMLS